MNTQILFFKWPTTASVLTTGSVLNLRFFSIVFSELSRPDMDFRFGRSDSESRRFRTVRQFE